VRNFTHAQKRNPLSDVNKILHVSSQPRRNHLRKFGDDRLRGLRVMGVEFCYIAYTFVVVLKAFATSVARLMGILNYHHHHHHQT